MYNYLFVILFSACHQPLGLESGDISDSRMTTPDGAVASGKEGKYARLNNWEAWCIPRLVSSDDVFRGDIYLEIDLMQERRITALALQGFGKYAYGDKIRIEYDIGENNFYEYDVVSFIVSFFLSYVIVIISFFVIIC